MKVASAKTKKTSEALLYVAGLAFFTLILLAPYMIIEEVGIIMMVAVAIAQNWGETGGQAARKVSGDNLFSFLASRSGEHA